MRSNIHSFPAQNRKEKCSACPVSDTMAQTMSLPTVGEEVPNNAAVEELDHRVIKNSPSIDTHNSSEASVNSVNVTRVPWDEKTQDEFIEISLTDIQEIMEKNKLCIQKIMEGNKVCNEEAVAEAKAQDVPLTTDEKVDGSDFEEKTEDDPVDEEIITVSTDKENGVEVPLKVFEKDLDECAATEDVPDDDSSSESDVPNKKRRLGTIAWFRGRGKNKRSVRPIGKVVTVHDGSTARTKSVGNGTKYRDVPNKKSAVWSSFRHKKETQNEKDMVVSNAKTEVIVSGNEGHIIEACISLYSNVD